MSEAVEGYPAASGSRHAWWRPWWRRVARQPVGAWLPPLGTRVGGYLLEARLGEGGQGTVYRARRGGRLYALKFLSLAMDGWAWRELEVRIRLRRVGEVGLEGCGQWPDRSPRFLYIVMPYVHGQPADAWARRKRPTARKTALLLRELARQLAPVHEEGVVHRDIKCANVLVRHEDGRPVLVDFGVGTYPGAPEITSPLVLPGTRRYRSPEMLRFRRNLAGTGRYRASALDDLWALGVFLYWLLTGSYPFDVEGHEGALADVILRGEPEPPHVRNPRVPRALSDLCLRMLEKAPEARYPSAEALGEALEAVLAQADADWDVALCEAYGPGDTAESRHALAPEAPTPTRRVLAWSGAAVLALGLLGLLVAPLLQSRPAPEAPPTTPPEASVSATPEVTSPAQEVAPRDKPPEGGEGAAPTRATTPAPVASATLRKDSTRVKTPQQLPSSPAEKKPQEMQKSAFGTAKKALTTACAVGQVAGCTGPAEQVRHTPSPVPPPVECPASSVETMKKELGLGMGVRNSASFVLEGDSRRVPVRPGTVTIWSGIQWGNLESDTPLTGEIFFGEGRVYGRFTQAHMKDGRTLPICMELYDDTRDQKRGVVMRSAPGDSVEIFSTVALRTGWHSE